jgi:hypothetical protein
MKFVRDKNNQIFVFCFLAGFLMWFFTEYFFSVEAFDVMVIPSVVFVLCGFFTGYKYKNWLSYFAMIFGCWLGQVIFFYSPFVPDEKQAAAIIGVLVAFAVGTSYTSVAFAIFQIIKFLMCILLFKRG